MSSIIGPFAGVEDDYRRERITESFSAHRRAGARRLFHRRPAARAAAAKPAIDWYGE
jgi:hypothetical protein